MIKSPKMVTVIVITATFLFIFKLKFLDLGLQSEWRAQGARNQPEAPGLGLESPKN